MVKFLKEIKYGFPPEHEDAVLALMEDAGITSFYIEKGEGLCTISVYDAEMPEGYPLYIQKISEVELSEDTWAGSYYEDIDGVMAGSGIYVRYNPEAPVPEECRYVIDIDPVNSFGDGNHPTTRMCLELLMKHIESLVPGTVPGLKMADIGTGTGILSILAHKMGLRNIEMSDIDPVSVEKSSKNLRRNGIDSLNPVVSDLYEHEFTDKYNIITANLLTVVIEDNIDKLVSALAHEGVIIFSGIGKRWTDEIMGLFDSRNLYVRAHEILDGWNGFMVIAGI